MDQSSKNNSNGRTKLIWILGWIFIFPVPLSILFIREQTKRSRKHAALLAGAWILYVVLICSAFINEGEPSSAIDSINTESVQSYESIEPKRTYNFTEQMTETTAVNDIEETRTIEQLRFDILSQFINEFNSLNELEITDQQTFDPQDRTSGKYRTEFRLNAYQDSLGMGGVIDDSHIDLISFSSDDFRIYYMSKSLDDIFSIFENALSVLDDSVSNKDVSDIRQHVEKHGFINPFSLRQPSGKSIEGTILYSHSSEYYSMLIKSQYGIDD